MRKRTLILSAAAIALAASFVTVHAAKETEAAMPAVGQIAPTFTLPSQDGTPISLEQYRGKWVVLYFYPKDMTTRLHHRGAQVPGRAAAVRGQERGDSGRERGHDRQPQAVLHQGWADLPSACGPRTQGGERVRLAGSFGPMTSRTATRSSSIPRARSPRSDRCQIQSFMWLRAQVGVLSFFIRYSKFVAKMAEKPAAVLLSMSLVGFMCGRFIGTVLMRYISPAKLLSIFCAMCVLLVFIALLLKGEVALYAIVPVPFFMSITSNHFCAGHKRVGCGNQNRFLIHCDVHHRRGVCATKSGLISYKTGSIQTAYIVPLLCFVVVLYYGLKGHKIRPNETVAENEPLSVIA